MTKKSKNSKKKPPAQTVEPGLAEERDEAGPSTVQGGFSSPVPPLFTRNRKRVVGMAPRDEIAPVSPGGVGKQTVPTPTQHAEGSLGDGGARVAQTVPTPTQQGGDVNVEPPAANLEITTSEPIVNVTENRGRAAEPGLPGIAGSGVVLDEYVFPGDPPPATLTTGPRIRLSDPAAATVKAQFNVSRQRLEQLRETLGGFHGNDATRPPGQNLQEVPFPEDELQTLCKVVDAAIDLHEAAVVSKPILDALENIRQIIEKIGEILKAAAKAGGFLTALAGEMYLAAEAIEAFGNKVAPLLGG